MKLNTKDILRGDPKATNNLMVAVRKSARIGSRKVGAESIEDDVAQEVAMLFLEKLIHKFDESYNVEPILIEASRRVALSLMRKNRELPVEDAAELLEDGFGDINERIGIDDNPVSALDQQKALQAIKMIMNPNGKEDEASEARQNPKADPAAAARAPKPSRRALSESCARLREIRVSLGMPQELFSSQLGIPTATLLSYEYGRTPNVPASIIERAEEIYKREISVAIRNQSQAARPMKEIVGEWAAMLNIDPNDHKTIADIVGVAKTTVRRWVDGEMRPRPRELNGYIRSVKIVAKRIRSSSKNIDKIY